MTSHAQSIMRAERLAARDDLLTINEAAELAHVSRRTIYLWIDSGKLRYCRVVSGSIRVFASSLFVEDPHGRAKI